MSFWDTSQYLKKAYQKKSKKIRGVGNGFTDLVTDLNLDDAVYTEGQSIVKGGKNNIEVSIIDRWYTTRVRVIIGIRYSEDLKVNYYLGNTNDGVTLKRISLSGIGVYWSKSFDVLSDLGLAPDLIVNIPEILSDTSKKESVKSLISSRWNLLKIRLDLAIMQVESILTDGSFVTAWNNCIESDSDIEASKGWFSMRKQLGNLLVTLVSDPSNLDLREIVLLIKINRGTSFRDYPQRLVLNKIMNKLSISTPGLSSEARKNLKEMSEKVEAHLELDRKLNFLEGLVQGSIDKSIDDFKAFYPELSTKKLDEIIYVETKRYIRYEDL